MIEHSVDIRNCPKCKTGTYAVQKEEKVGTFANSIKDASVAALQKQFLAEVKKLVTASEKKVSSAKVAEREATAAVRVAEEDLRIKRAALEALEKIIGIVKPVRGELYYLASRTRKNAPGHFIEQFSDKTTKCQCEGGRYGGDCWAQKWIRDNPYGRNPFLYQRGGYMDSRIRNFDAHLMPYMHTSYVPTTIKPDWLATGRR